MLKSKVEYYSNGNKRYEQWIREYPDGSGYESHREDGPAWVTYYKNGMVDQVIWIDGGLWHREDGPTFISYRKDGSIANTTWYFDGEKHKEDGPASTHYDKNGKIISQEWCIHGERHRDEGPAIIEYHEGNIVGKFWYINDTQHREDGPAIVKYNMDDLLPSETVWIQSDYYHRLDGPAEIEWGHKTWCLFNESFSDEQEYLNILDLGYSIRTRDQAIMNYKHPCKYIRLIAQEVLHGQS